MVKSLKNDIKVRAAICKKIKNFIPKPNPMLWLMGDTFFQSLIGVVNLV
jgi:hypothetical protein